MLYIYVKFKLCNLRIPCNNAFKSSNQYWTTSCVIYYEKVSTWNLEWLLHYLRYITTSFPYSIHIYMFVHLWCFVLFCIASSPQQHSITAQFWGMWSDLYPIIISCTNYVLLWWNIRNAKSNTTPCAAQIWIIINHKPQKFLSLHYSTNSWNLI